MQKLRAVATTIGLVGVLALGGLAPAGADTTAVSYTCDLPAGATGVLAAQIPDTITDSFDVTVVDSPDPVLQGGTTHLDLDVPFPDITTSLPDVGISYGFFYIKRVDIWQPLPAGINWNTVTATLSPSPNWATVAREGGNLKVRIESAVPGSYIRVNADATPPTIEIEVTSGNWQPLDFVPSVDVDAVVTGARGNSINWKAPTLNAVVKYQRNVFGLIDVNWNDANTPCIPDDPNQVIVSTLIASPAMTATLSRTEATVKVGETIHYDVAVANTGDIGLTGVTATIPGATCATPPSSVAVGETAHVACTRIATVADIGSFTRTASVDTAETTGTTTNAVSTTVNPRRAADAEVGTALAGPFAVNGTYSPAVTPAQTAKANVARGAARNFYVRIGNDGDATDSLTVRGVDSGAAGYKVSYFDAVGTNITAAVKAGTYVVPDLAPGATTTLRVKVKATTTSVRGSGHNADVRVTSSNDAGATDVVRAKVKRT
ncbi:MAG: hypothetical protein JNK12_23920 [Acidimicrobiales bacterium]|nr:hypothetical protein [Acidimicrobiales bacterium]